jgi:2-polyprenyl-3-methyl-5-hydroxy-6-metoxy-1,4-benzoquinol methylase
MPKRNKTCPICASLKVHLKYKCNDLLYAFDGKFDYLNCPDCGAMFLSPFFSNTEIQKYYPAEYLPHQQPGQKKKSGGLLNALKKIFHANLVDIKNLGYLRKYLNNKSKLLDVGCGNGAFLHKVRQEIGCRVFGIDISPNAVAAARYGYNLDIKKGFLQENSFPARYFDVITAWWYLEHVNNPTEILTAMKKMLKDDGILAIGVPNGKGLVARLFGKNWFHLDAPRHMILYSKTSITQLLKANGFVVKKISYDRSTWGLMGSLQYLINRNDRKKRIKNSVFLRLFFLPFTFILACLKSSDIMVVYAQKHSVV